TWAKPGDFDDLTRLVRERFGATLVLLDFDQDGKPDIFICSAVVRNKQVGDLLLHNVGDGVFKDVTVSAGLAGPGSLGCAVADYDNDGFPDLLLTGTGVRLYRNRGEGTFQDMSATAGLKELKGVFFSATWLDIDQDGDLDLILSRFAESPETAVAQLQGKDKAQGEFLVFLNT